MKLQNNPFFILGLPCSAGRREIVAAADELCFLLDADTCSNAQNELINLNKRLSAELSWFLDAEKADIQAIQDDVNNNIPLSTDGLSSLSKLNATLYNFSIAGEEDPYELGYSILDIDEQYSALDYSYIANVVNRNRIAAKIAVVKDNDISEELNRKRDDIRQAISDRLASLDQDTYVELITMLAEKCIADDDYEDGVVLSDVVDQYEVKMQAQLEESTERIESHIDHIHHLANDEAIGDNVKSLIRQVQKWDMIAQPLQLKSKASGVPHGISENLGYDIRDLALYLHNEKGKTSEALTLVNAMRKVFAEIEGLLDSFDVDSEVLNDLLKGQKEANEILAEMDALQKQSESIKEYATSANVDSYIERIKALNGRIKLLDLDDETKEKARKNICYLARETAVELHNTKRQTEYALRIAKAINMVFKDISSLTSKLKMDEMTLTVQLAQTGRSAPSYGSSVTGSYKSKSSNTGCLVSIIIGVVILIAIAIGSSGGTTSSNPSTAPSSKPSQGYSTNSNSSSSTPSQKPSATPNTSSGTSQSELDKLRKDIEGMETRLKSMSSDIEDMENELESLSDDLDYYEERYNATGNNTYYNSFYDTRDDYNALYDDYSDAIDSYNALYDKYSKAIDEYNSKIN